MSTFFGNPPDVLYLRLGLEDLWDVCHALVSLETLHVARFSDCELWEKGEEGFPSAGPRAAGES